MIVSVIIPTYNRRSFTVEAIESVISQTRKPDEIIVVDDGSQDDTITTVSGLFGNQVICLKQNNMGVSAARNTGIRAAKGDWLCFLDSDDLWIPHKLEKQLRVISSNRDIFACYTNEIWIRHGVRVNQCKIHQKYGGYIFEKCLPLCIISPSSIILHRKIIEDIGPFDEQLEICEDYDMWLRMTTKYNVMFLDEPLITKRGGHTDQLSHKYWGNDRFRVKSLLKLIETYNLTQEQKRAAIGELKRKCSILADGFSKRSNTKESEYYRNIINKY